MSAIKTLTLRCDGADATTQPRQNFHLIPCKNTFPGDASETLKALRSRAKQLGWIFKDGAWDYCPVHAAAYHKTGTT